MARISVASKPQKRATGRQARRWWFRATTPRAAHLDKARQGRHSSEWQSVGERRDEDGGGGVTRENPVNRQPAAVSPSRFANVLRSGEQLDRAETAFLGAGCPGAWVVPCKRVKSSKHCTIMAERCQLTELCIDPSETQSRVARPDPGPKPGRSRSCPVVEKAEMKEQPHCG